MSRVRGARSLQGIVSTVVVLLVINGAMADTVDTCPEGFTCHWEGDVFVLHSEWNCELLEDMPVNTSRLTVSCDRPPCYVYKPYVDIAVNTSRLKVVCVIYDVNNPYASWNVLQVLSSYWSQHAILKTIDLVSHSRNVITFTDMGLFFPLLEHVSLTGIIDCGYTKGLLSLISHEHVKSIYATSGKQNTPFMSWCAISVSTIMPMNRTTSQLPIQHVGSQLEFISFNGALLYTGSLPYMSFPEREIQINDSSNVLRYVDMSSFQTSSCINIAFTGLHAIDYCNIQNIRSIDPDVLKEMHNVTVLLLGNNDLDYVVANDTENLLFRDNKHLKILDLAGCQLTEIPTKEFVHLQHLQQLNLSSNSLEAFHVELHTLNELIFLNLSTNKLKTVSAAMRVQLDQMAADRHVQVDISRNPFECTCSDIEFVLWVQNSRMIFQNKNNTFCTDHKSNSQPLFRIDTGQMENDCNLARYTSFITSSAEPTTENHKDNVLMTTLIATIVVFVLISVVLCVAYIYRWKCAYVWNRFKKCTTSTDVQLKEVVYDRDAFICYNSNDSGWVCHDLLDHLDSSGISTVIHHRDFLPGSVLEETIRESIDRSRFTVLVLSPDFLASNWCRLEMHIARNRIISEGRDVIVPIILREFPTSQMTRTLAGILSKSYLQWTDDKDGQALFWDKLITKLKHGGNLRPLEK